MEGLFLSVLKMSLTASYVSLFVILIRFPLKKAPKVITYALWSVVAFRLICPFSFESMFSFLPQNLAVISQKTSYQQNVQASRNIISPEIFVSRSQSVAATDFGADPLQMCIQAGTYLWILGIASMLVYSMVSVVILKKRLRNSRYVELNIYEVDNLKTPFVLGLFKPRIFIPVRLDVEEKSYIIRHEQTHIRRLDHIIKPFAFLILSIHWFNPLVWVAFILMSTDMELSCDERVIKEMGNGIKRNYSNSLLSLASGKRILNGSPLAFGEGNVKGRIKNVLNYKKPGFWGVAVVIIVVVAISVGLLANPRINSALESTAAEWSKGQNMGADFPILDYASDKIVIFHGYFGLFVYELDSGKFINTLDLQAIGCEATQGDNYCEVSVSSDGNRIQLHPASSENMYLYTLSDSKMKEVVYEPMEDKFDGLISTADVMSSDKIGNCSYSSVKFDNGKLGYLQASEWTIDSLTYVYGNKVYRLFD